MLYFPLLGAALADSYLGKVKTVLIFNIVYILGIVSLTISAVPKISGDYNLSGKTNLILARVHEILIRPGYLPHAACVMLMVSVLTF